MTGAIHFVDSGPQVLAFTRSLHGQTMLCVFNLSDRPEKFELARALRDVEAFDVAGFSPVLDGATIRLDPHHAFFGAMAKKA